MANNIGDHNEGPCNHRLSNTKKYETTNNELNTGNELNTLLSAQIRFLNT